MPSSRVAGVTVLLALLAPVQQRPAAAPASCESLSSLRLQNATVTSATASRGRRIYSSDGCSGPRRCHLPSLARWRPRRRSAASR